MLSFLLFFILILYDQKPHVAAIFCGASSRLFLLSQTLPGGTQFFCSAMNVCLLLSCVRLFVNPWTVAHQAPLSMGFCRQEYWSGLPCPSPGDLPDPGIEPRSPALQANSLPFELPGKPPLLWVTHLEILERQYLNQRNECLIVGILYIT